MKECAYCGHQNPDTAIACSGCGTDEFKSDAPAENSEPEGEEEFVTLETLPNISEADVVMGRLEAAGIDAFMPDEQSVQTLNVNLNAYGFIRIQVRRKDLANARELLSAQEM